MNYSEFPLDVTPANEAEFKRILRARNAEFCRCGHEIGFGDLAWNLGNTEAGTPHSFFEIQCVACQAEIVHLHSWACGFLADDDVTIDDPTYLLKEVDEAWSDKERYASQRRI